MVPAFRAAAAAGLSAVLAVQATAATPLAATSFETALQYPESVAYSTPAVASECSKSDASVSLVSDCESCDACADDSIGCCEACDCGSGCDCGACVCNCGPTWIVYAGAVLLNREDPDPGRIVSTVNQFNVISSGDDYDFDWEGGPEVSIARRTARGNLWEFRYLGVPESDATVDYGAVGPFQLGAFNASAPDNLTGIYESSVHSTEINWHHPLTERFTPLVGFRWVELSDTLHYTATFPGAAADWDWNQNNHLYGGQIGGTFDAGRILGQLSLTSAVKAGVYGNSADNDFTLTVSNGQRFDGGAAATDVAFVGELVIRAAYPITRHASLVGGYQLLWIEQVALASDQAAVATVTLDDDQIANGAGVFYHGATGGIEFTW